MADWIITKRKKPLKYMNYDNINRIYDYWANKIEPHLSQKFTMASPSFGRYIQAISFLPTFKWIKDIDKSVSIPLLIVVDPELFSKKYKSCCICHYSPSKPEEGLKKIIYQISPTLHAEMNLFVWNEHEVVYSYGSFVVVYNNDKELKKFCEELLKMRRTGNTEDGTKKMGFLPH